MVSKTRRTTVSIAEDLERTHDDLLDYVAGIKGMSLSRFLWTAAGHFMNAGIEDPATVDLAARALWGSEPGEWQPEPEPAGERTTLSGDALAALDKLVS